MKGENLEDGCCPSGYRKLNLTATTARYEGSMVGVPGDPQQERVPGTRAGKPRFVSGGKEVLKVDDGGLD